MDACAGAHTRVRRSVFVGTCERSLSQWPRVEVEVNGLVPRCVCVCVCVSAFRCTCSVMFPLFLSFGCSTEMQILLLCYCKSVSTFPVPFISGFLCEATGGTVMLMQVNQEGAR